MESSFLTTDLAWSLWSGSTDSKTLDYQRTKPRWQPTRLHCPWDYPGKNTGVGCHFLLQCMKVKSQSEVAQSCPTPSNPMDCSLQGSSIHGIFQARVLEWGAIAFSDTPMSKAKQSNKIKYSRLTQQTKEIKNYIYQLRPKPTKAQTGKQN